jgi:hypothetical protein
MAQSGDVVRTQLAAPGPNRILVNEKLTPQTSNMLEHLDQRIAGLKGDPMSLEEVDQLRRELGQYRDAAWANNASDGRAASAAVRAFNEHINKSVNSGDFIGSPGARQAWNDAVAASSKYASKFRSNDQVGSVVEKVLGDNRNPAAIPNDVADHLYGASGVNPNSQNVALANRFKKVLGENSKEWGAVKQGLFQRLTERGAGQDDFGPGQVANRLNKFLNGDGKEMAEAMYSPAERDMMQKFAHLHRQLDIPKDLASHPEAKTVLRPLFDWIRNKVVAAVGAGVAHYFGAGPLIELGASAVAGGAEKLATGIRQTVEIKKQLPLVTEQVTKFQRALAAHTKANSPPSAQALTIATANLARSLKPLGIDLSRGVPSQWSTASIGNSKEAVAQ